MKAKVYKNLFLPRYWAATILCSLLFSALQAASPGDTLTCVAHGACTNGPSQEFSKKINREFYTSANGTTAVYNRHGKIQVHTWAEKKVKMNITILVNARDQKEADRILNTINVNFTNTNGYIKAETFIGDQNSTIFTKNNCYDFSINYDVWIPTDNQLDLSNRYGDCYVANMNGKLISDVKYGDLHAETVKSDAHLKIEYGKATLKSAQNLYGQVGYGGITVDQADNIQMETRNSECTFRRAKDVRISSKYDDLDLGAIGELRLQTKFSDVKTISAKSAWITSQYSDVAFGNISNLLDANCQYGDLTVEKVQPGFESVSLTGLHTDMQINTSGSAFRFNIQSEQTDVKYPSQAIFVQLASPANRIITKNGYTGSSSAKSMVKAQLKYGGLSFR
jgi:hypothetical protein